jgi:hypothetical protein
MLVGNQHRFAIESKITQVYPLTANVKTQQARGCFLVHVCGRSYGVESEDASMLGFIADSVRQRIDNRHLHGTRLYTIERISNLADALVAATLHADAAIKFDGLSGADIYNIINETDIDWAPGLDEAFDGGYHLFQLDAGNRVRLIGCKVSDDMSYGHLSDITLPSDDFYNILSDWHALYVSQVGAMLDSIKRAGR